jgi:L-rhamnose 1-dehydrogenase
MINNKTILITGGASGIGNAAVKLFLENNNKVIVIDKNIPKKKDKNLYFYKLDLTKIKLIRSIVKKISLKFNKIDVLILNAGICPFEKFLKIDQKLFDLVVDVNQKSAFFLAQEVAKLMIKKRISGKIIFTSSISSIFGGELQSHYCGTKGAINQMMKSICISLGKHNINVNAVLPGTVITNINKKQLSKNYSLKKYFIKRTPLKRLITSDEIAKVMLFLASDLSSGISGETILVDGGMAINFQ